MRKLYHYPICPISRQIRVILKEMGPSPFTLMKEDYWKRRREFLKINPAGTIPVLEENEDFLISGIYPIIEYLNDSHQDFHLMSKDVVINSEIRRLFWWFNDKFYKEVTKILIDEKIIRLMSDSGAPRTEFIKAAKINLLHHLNYLHELLEVRSFIACDHLSIADVAAGCHISVIDYFGEIDWKNWPTIQAWYSVIKSRPSFRQILQDHIPGFTPSSTYADLDF